MGSSEPDVCSRGRPRCRENLLEILDDEDDESAEPDLCSRGRPRNRGNLDDEGDHGQLMESSPMSAAASDNCFNRPMWDVAQTALLCEEGEEDRFADQAELLKEFHSVSAAVEYLNTDEGYREVSEGICVVFSETRRKYFLLYRTDQKAAALIIFNLTENDDNHKTLRV